MEFLIYDLKVAVLVAVFYMFYRLLLSRETFHRVNRMVLLATAIASYVLPLCVITLHKTVVVELTEASIGMEGLSAELVDEAPRLQLWQLLAIILFLIGVATTLVYTITSLLRVWMLIRRSEQHLEADGTIVCVVDGDVSPFSWMHYIVLSRSDYEAQDASILAHERGHIRRHHSLDLILVDTLTALQWFNPAMWMLRQDLRAIHEYEADAAVLSQGINMRQYQYLLIQKAVSRCGYSVANGISHSTLKNRITMMLHKNSKRTSLLKLLALVPIVGVALALNAETVNDYVYKDTQEQPQKKIVKKGRKNGQVKIGNNTIEVKAEEPAAKEEMKATVDTKAPVIELLNNNGEDPLFVIDGKKATLEQFKALDQKTIDHINVVKASEENKDLRRVYGDKFNADTSNGIIFIITKEYAKSDERKKDYVVVVKKKDSEKEATPTATGSFTPDPSETEMPFDVVEQMPEYPGGIQEMMKFLSENVKYPVAAMKTGVQGRVVVQFIVEKDGTVTSGKVMRSVNEELDAEALRVVNAMPKWTPGKQKGQAVRVKYTLPISFRLS